MTKRIFILILCCFVIISNSVDISSVYARNKSKKAAIAEKKKSPVRDKKHIAKNNNKSSKENISSGNKKYYNEKGDLKQHQKELENLNKSITQTKQKLNTLKVKEKNEVGKLNQHKQKSTVLKKDIKILTKKIVEYQDTISVLRTKQESLKSKLNRLQKEYADLLKEYYLNTNPRQLQIVSSLTNPFKELKKEIYIKSLTRHLGKLANEIVRTNDSINKRQDVFEVKTNEQFVIKYKKEIENNKVQKTIAGQEVKIDQIRKDKNLLSKQLADMQSSARKLKGIINQLIQNEIAKEKKKEEKIATKETKSKTESTKSEKRVAALELPSETKRTAIGRLVWPTNSHSISKYYGSNKNPETNTIFENPGVDISVKVGSPVIAVANGVVSLIHWLPGYGTLIIINHGAGLRSVYANLSSVNVKKDQSVKQGSVIGRTGETVDGAILHFELWQGSNRLNPLGYIR